MGLLQKDAEPTVGHFKSSSALGQLLPYPLHLGAGCQEAGLASHACAPGLCWQHSCCTELTCLPPSMELCMLPGNTANNPFPSAGLSSHADSRLSMLTLLGHSRFLKQCQQGNSDSWGFVSLLHPVHPCIIVKSLKAHRRQAG